MVISVDEYGTAVSKKYNCLVFTRPGMEKEVCIEAVTELLITNHSSITMDAISLCLEHNVRILLLDFRGNPKGEFCSFEDGCSPMIKRRQLQLQNSGVGVTLSVRLVGKKVYNRILHLKELEHNRKNKKIKQSLLLDIERMTELYHKIKALKGERMQDIRPTLQGLEGSAGHIYFSAISTLLPPDYKFKGRSVKGAVDKYNCILNYMYGILYGDMKNICYQARLDPYIGIMHVDNYNKPTFTYDLVEAYRIYCERAAYELCRGECLADSDFTLEDEYCRISVSGKRIIVQAYFEKMNQAVTFHKKKTSVIHKITMEVKDIAKYILNLDSKELEDVFMDCV